MLALILIAHFLVALIFSGYTDNWKLFDFWWGGGAVMCGALLLGRHPVRIHFLSFFLIPALLILLTGRVFAATAVHACGWWLIALSLFILLPTLLAGRHDLPAALFTALRWCGAILTILYAIQIQMNAQGRGIGLMRSAEAQILLGGLAGSLLAARLGRVSRSAAPGAGVSDAGRVTRWAWSAVLCAGILLNGSRSGLLGLGLVFLAYLWIHLSARRMAVAVGAAALAAVLALTAARVEMNPLAELRPRIFFMALNIFSNDPGGSGLGMFSTEMMSREFPVTDPRILAQFARINHHAHNVLLQWAAESGILGIATCLAFLICAARLVQRCAAAPGADWPRRAGLIWAPAFIFELMVNITETLAPIRWMGLVGLVALTADVSVVMMRRSTALFRLSVVLVGAFLLYTGIQDLFARQSMRAGMNEESAERLPEAMASYEESARLRPWDEQPRLHLAQAAVRAGHADLADRSIESALERSENPSAVLYHGSRMYRILAGAESRGPFYQKGRQFILSLGQLQTCDQPMAMEAADWSRTERERDWRFHRVLQFEPRAARVYDRMADAAHLAGRAGPAEKYSELAALIREFYGPQVRQKFLEYSIFNKNSARYDAWLLSRSGPEG
ncbi:O-antigen ligase family protein [bacterium]|nr:O-antigen ligase family protein [bacterium]